MPTATLVSSNPAGWAPGTRHYSTSDGRWLAVEATTDPGGTHVIERGQSPNIDDLLAVMGESRAALKMVVRPTVVFLSDEHGDRVDADENDHDPLTPLHVFPAGTTHEEALTAAGYTLEENDV